MGAIPTFPSFTTGEIPTAAKLNLMKTAVDFWALTPRVSVGATAAQSIASSGSVYVLFTTWDTELFDVVQAGDTEMHSTVTNPERLFCRTTGKYQLGGQVTFDANATGLRSLMIRANSAGNPASGTQIVQTAQGASASGRTSIPIPPIIRPLTAGDYLECFVLQNSGGALLTTGGVSNTFLQAKLDSV